MGSSDDTAENYSVLNLGNDVTIDSVENVAIKVNTSNDSLYNNNRTYGSVVNISGAKITAPTAVHVSDYANLHLVGNIADNSPIVTIDNNTDIITTDSAIDAGMFAHWYINNATIESDSDVISMRTGNMTVDGDASLSTDGEGTVEVIDATYEDGYLVFQADRFSTFYAAYEDTETPVLAPTPEPAPEEEEVPSTPETGAETAKAGGIISSTLILCALIGLTVSAFTYFKLFRKR